LRRRHSTSTRLRFCPTARWLAYVTRESGYCEVVVQPFGDPDYRQVAGLRKSRVRPVLVD
jgi:hypothetical protein